MDLEPFYRLLQMSISPMVLISGVGLLLLSATNRLARPIDRVRALKREMEAEGNAPNAGDVLQVGVLLKRAAILQWAIGLLVFSILAAILMILLMIGSAFSPLAFHAAIVVLLTVSVLSIFLSVLLLLYDVTLALKALRIEVHTGSSPMVGPSNRAH